MKKYQESADALRKAIELQPDLAGAHTTLASVLRQLGDSAGADAEAKAGYASSARRRPVSRQRLSPLIPGRGCSRTAISMAPSRNFALPSTPCLPTLWLIISWPWPSHNKVRKTNPAVNFRKRRNWIRTWWFHTSL